MNRTIEAILKLSAKLGSTKAFSDVGAKLDDVSGKAARYNRQQSAIAKGAKSAHAAIMRVAAPAALAYGAQRSFMTYAALERRMERIGITADASAEETRRALGVIRRVADDTGQPVGGLVEGFEQLVAAGRSMSEATAQIDAIGATAHAADASNAEIAATADAIGVSFGILSDEMQSALDILVYYGQLGKFELKDMAAHLPSLAPAFAALGYEGEKGLARLASILQVIRMETGTAGEAATAAMDVFTKMESETVVNKFANFGVDLRQELDAVRASGEDVLEAFIRLSVETVDGDLSKLPQLFADKQMQIGMRALINRTDDLRVMLGKAGEAAGSTERNIERLSQNSQASIDRMSNAWQQLSEQMGQGISPVITPVMEWGVDQLSYDNAVVAGMEKEGKSWGEITRYSASRMAGMDDQSQTDLYARQGGFVFDGDEELADRFPERYRSARDIEALRHTAGLLPGDLSADSGGESTERFPIPRPRPRPGQDDPPVMVPRSDWFDALSQGAAYPVPDRMQPYAPLQLPAMPPHMASPSPMAFDALSAEGGVDDQAAAAADRLLEFKRAAEEAGGVLAQGADDAGAALTEGGQEAGRSISDAAGPAGQEFGEAASGLIRSEAASAGSAFGQAAAAEIRTAADGAVQRLEGAAGRLARRRARGNPGRTMEEAGTAE